MSIPQISNCPLPTNSSSPEQKKMLGKLTKINNAMWIEKLINFDLMRKKIKVTMFNAAQIETKYIVETIQLPEEPKRHKLADEKFRYDAKTRTQDSTKSITREKLAKELPKEPNRLMQDEAKTSKDSDKQTLHSPKSRRSNWPRPIPEDEHSKEDPFKLPIYANTQGRAIQGRPNCPPAPS